MSATQYSYDSFGRLQCTAVRMNSAAWTSLPSDACTQGTAGTNGPDRITKNVYDAANQLLQVRQVVGTSLEEAHVTYSYTVNGKQQDVVDANGNHAKFVYDGFDRPVQWTFPSTTAASAFNGSTPANALATANALNTGDYEQYGYDANSNRTSFRRRDGRVFTLGYDALNRATSKVLTTATCALTCTSAPSSALRSVYYGYDLQGHQLYARFDGGSGADGVTSGYTGFGELASSTTAMGGTSRTFSYLYDADGNRTRITHPDGNWFGGVYDGLDRLATLNENGGTQIGSLTYDAQAHPVSETRAGVTSSYVYDGLDRLYQTQYPSSTKGAGTSNSSDYEQFTYDENGNVTARRQRDNTNIGFTYDALNRVTLTDLPGTDPDTSYSYDLLGRLTGATKAPNPRRSPTTRWAASSARRGCSARCRASGTRPGGGRG